MDLSKVYELVEEFSKETHGSSDYDKEKIFVRGKNPAEFAPFKFLAKKIDELNSPEQLLKNGFVYDSLELFHDDRFSEWFKHQFSRKLTQKLIKGVNLLHEPNGKAIFDCVELVNKSYEILRDEQIIINGKNLPVQLGEWYAKCIFGLEQRKSTSQRGFDFYVQDKRVEVKVHWADQSSPKGVKLRKSLIDLSEYTIIVYLAKNFTIREICFLDSDFVMRKFSSKGHTLFLKDGDISTYFFSNSNKHADKVVNSSSLMRFANPTFAMKISEYFN